MKKHDDFLVEKIGISIGLGLLAIGIGIKIAKKVGANKC